MITFEDHLVLHFGGLGQRAAKAQPMSTIDSSRIPCRVEPECVRRGPFCSKYDCRIYIGEIQRQQQNPVVRATPADCLKTKEGLSGPRGSLEPCLLQEQWTIPCPPSFEEQQSLRNVSAPTLRRRGRFASLRDPEIMRCGAAYIRTTSETLLHVGDRPATSRLAEPNCYPAQWLHPVN